MRHTRPHLSCGLFKWSPSATARGLSQDEPEAERAQQTLNQSSSQDTQNAVSILIFTGNAGKRHSCTSICVSENHHGHTTQRSPLSTGHCLLSFSAGMVRLTGTLACKHTTTVTSTVTQNEISYWEESRDPVYKTRSLKFMENYTGSFQRTYGQFPSPRRLLTVATAQSKGRY